VRQISVRHFSVLHFQATLIAGYPDKHCQLVPKGEKKLSAFMGVDLQQKVGTKSENYWFEKPGFLKPSKMSKVQILGFLFFLFVLQFIVLIKFNFIF